MRPIPRLPGEPRGEQRVTATRLRQLPHETLRVLVEDCGARPATSVGEARAAAFLDGRLRRAGMRVTADTLRARALPGREGLAIALLALAAAPLTAWLPLAGLALAGMALALAGMALTAAGVPWLAPPQMSQNIIGTRAAIDAPARRLVLLAPLDARLPAWHPIARLGHTGADLARAAVAGLLLLLALLAALWPQPLWAWLQALPAGLLLLSAIADGLALARAQRAGDPADAAGLAVLLAASEGIEELAHTEVWAIGLGATSSGAGLADLQRRYPFDRQDTMFLALDAGAAGELAYRAPGGGAPADPQLLAWAEIAGRRADVRAHAAGPAGPAARAAPRGMRQLAIAVGAPAGDDRGEGLARAAQLVVTIAQLADQAG